MKNMVFNFLLSFLICTEPSSDDFGSIEESIRNSGRYLPPQSLLQMSESSRLFQTPTMSTEQQKGQQPDLIPASATPQVHLPTTSTRHQTNPFLDDFPELPATSMSSNFSRTSSHRSITHHPHHHVSTTYITLDPAGTQETASTIYISTGPVSSTSMLSSAAASPSQQESSSSANNPGVELFEEDHFIRPTVNINFIAQ